MAFFRVEELSMWFGGLAALDGVGFEILQGSIFSVIGPNGAGKTTLFNCINGIYKPASGSILLNGRELTGQKPHAIAKLGVARTFQNIELFSQMTLMENLMLGRHLFMKTGLFRGGFMWGRKSFAGREEVLHRKKAGELIELLELQEYRGRPVGALPYGIQKRVELGRALAMEPKLILLDEPCAGMNAEERRDMIMRIKTVKEALGAAVFLIEHDMAIVMDISDQVLVMNFGKPVAQGTPGQVQAHPEVAAAYLGEDDPDECLA
ncbi:amino acid/amide ABC transporter ATP-binding protein 1, HAAT family [Desulfatibacillum alkenivorans DSM 16219]|jgi:branched-chain amino acid transport system ATP-binding protein|uniref:Amino acid/amide ABC transporter ATP-binding protein 1, HAAT family n=1 Tax=Desulfatibacillum alkenivorans DSM 16219 TaxID=1121393 RepID=A0A1M6JYG0_9BACT|nr:ABC transporter ATP-binding protein [Desulfatibacillum alkenivorans]SHJ51759.1 amino acid/amide ABC transporter ATP-binding protein 1, HAAT family [Desulfatibacillum alkenivorans DSM 16219]